MQRVDFGGSDRLIPLIDEAVRQRTVAATTLGVKDSLKALINGGAIDLPAEVQVPGPDTYGRHLLYRSDDLQYVVVAMAWGAGQGTPIHDHAGVWCVEGVWCGELEVTQYDLREQEGDRFRFERQERFNARPGDSGALIPPYEYHTLANLRPDETTVTIHVYGRDLDDCCIFEPASDAGWYRKQVKDLRYDN
jgi:predicted metal-dependent enzyme (double-stranded beta helix superfamily)